jgi:hypothetical protein
MKQKENQEIKKSEVQFPLLALFIFVIMGIIALIYYIKKKIKKE